MAPRKPAHSAARPRTRRLSRLRVVVPASVLAVALIAALTLWAAAGPSQRHPGSLSPKDSKGKLVSSGAGSTSTTVAPTLTTAQGVIATWVQKENAKPGTKDWQITKAATGHQIEGYANQVSVDPFAGSPTSVDLYVSTPAPTYVVQAFRMGYYGGDEGRLIWSSATLPGGVQASCPLTPGVNTVECAWKLSLTVPVDPRSWPQGDYLFKLTASTGYESYIPLTVRDDSSHSAYVVNNSVTTWEAYNVFGGYDLYQGANGSLATRARIVSFDRPYKINGDTTSPGGGDFVGLELKMVAMMESLGLDVSYTTDVDLDRAPQLVLQHRTFISLGHDEYYSMAMRDSLQNARDHGVNLIFLGANAVYRHIRLQPSPLGADRQEIDYKAATADPLYGKNNADVTPWAWRSPPNNAPESVLLGEMWQCNPVRADMVITDPGNWMFSGTGLVSGSRIANIVGPEYDHFSSSEPNPGDVTVVASSPVDCNGLHSTADMTYYSAPSKAGVWDTGTIDWVGSIMPYTNRAAAPDVVTHITDNVLAAFGSGPAGIAHPSTANAG